jgi:muramoyltetrapeptide carboxypeptidase
MIIPPYLKAGDTIGICCPSGALTLDAIQPMIAQLEFWGFDVKIGKTVGASWAKFAGTDLERLQDIQDMLNDPEIKAICFGRGGYGMVRIIDFINWNIYKKNPKWLVGFSDITVLHNHVHTNVGVATLHAHMQGGYAAEGFDNDSTMSIYHALTGKPTSIIINTVNENEINSCKGELIGGNLAVISDLIGTRSDIDTVGKILFLEDIGEYKYNIDRMMWQLYRAKKLHHLAGLIVGGFTDVKDDEPNFPMTPNEIIWEKVGNFKYPVTFGFPVGHQSKNHALKVGVMHELNIEKNKISLTEIIEA